MAERFGGGLVIVTHTDQEQNLESTVEAYNYRFFKGDLESLDIKVLDRNSQLRPTKIRVAYIQVVK